MRRLPEAQNLNGNELKKETPQGKLEEKGIPARNFNKIFAKIKFWLHQLWGIALEAKDLRPKPGAYQLKKLFQHKSKPKPEPVFHSPEQKNQTGQEAVLLLNIKTEPKELKHYDALGKFYLDSGQYEDAKNIYLYLVGHEVGNANFHARLAQAAFLLKDFTLSESHFHKSLALDKMHPNRYYNLGLSQECQSKWHEALISFSKAAEMQPENQKYLSALQKAREQIE